MGINSKKKKEKIIYREEQRLGTSIYLPAFFMSIIPIVSSDLYNTIKCLLILAVAWLFLCRNFVIEVRESALFVRRLLQFAEIPLIGLTNCKNQTFDASFSTCFTANFQRGKKDKYYFDFKTQSTNVLLEFDDGRKIRFASENPGKLVAAINTISNLEK